MEQVTVQYIAINDINILNPRARNQVIAEGIHQNIKRIGLKRPITVTVAEHNQNGRKYDLVCDAIITSCNSTLSPLISFWVIVSDVICCSFTLEIASFSEVAKFCCAS